MIRDVVEVQILLTHPEEKVYVLPLICPSLAFFCSLFSLLKVGAKSCIVFLVYLGLFVVFLEFIRFSQTQLCIISSS